jgi:hypothetical protein
MLHISVRWPEWWPVDAWVGQEIFPPIFNIADMAITFGVAWIILQQKNWLGKGALWMQSPAAPEEREGSTESS